jgi:hypothetical protein
VEIEGKLGTAVLVTCAACTESAARLIGAAPASDFEALGQQISEVDEAIQQTQALASESATRLRAFDFS